MAEKHNAFAVDDDWFDFVQRTFETLAQPRLSSWPAGADTRNATNVFCHCFGCQTVTSNHAFSRPVQQLYFAGVALEDHENSPIGFTTAFCHGGLFHMSMFQQIRAA